MQIDKEMSEIIERLRAGLASDAEREKYVQFLEHQHKDTIGAVLDKLPVHQRWCAEIGAGYRIKECWDEHNFDPSKSALSVNHLILIATITSKAMISNGGFAGFFSSELGKLAPEALVGFENMGFHDAANEMRKAVMLLGSVFPRSQAEREVATLASQELLESYSRQFHRLLKSRGRNAFDLACDNYLQELENIK